MKKIIGHHITTALLVVAICVATYGFWGSYHAYRTQKDTAVNLQDRLQHLRAQQQELSRKEAILRQVAVFTDQAQELGLVRHKWTFYDVNVQAPLSYETAQEIISQCRDSSSAYFWPISLDVKSQTGDAKASSVAAKKGEQGDVQLLVKGKFVARQ